MEIFGYTIIKTHDLWTKEYQTKREHEEEVEKEEVGKHQFKPFDRVLVRDSDKDKWLCELFSHIEDGYYFCINCGWKQCVPYEGNEHLVGTADSPK